MPTPLNYYVFPTADNTFPNFNTLAGAAAHLKAINGNLVGTDQNAVVEISGSWSSADTAYASFDTITTDATRDVKVFTTGTARHSGKWDETNNSYRLVVSQTGVSTVGALAALIDNIWIDGLQIRVTNNDGNYQAPITTSAPSSAIGTWLRVSNCILRQGGTSSREPGIYANSTNLNLQIWNTVIYGLGSSTSAQSCGLYLNCATAQIYSCTIVGGALYGISRIAGTVTAKNTYATGNTAGWNGVAGITTVNCSTSGTELTGGTDVESVAKNTDTFVNVTAGSEDFHLAADGLSPLQGVGVDTTGDASPMNFTTDIDGQTRDASWDIGADAWYVAASGGNRRRRLILCGSR